MVHFINRKFQRKHIFYTGHFLNGFLDNIFLKTPNIGNVLTMISAVFISNFWIWTRQNHAIFVFSVQPETIYYENVDLSLINTLCSEGHSKVIFFHINTKDSFLIKVLISNYKFTSKQREAVYWAPQTPPPGSVTSLISMKSLGSNGCWLLSPPGKKKEDKL